MRCLPPKQAAGPAVKAASRALACLTLLLILAASALAANPVQTENARAGTTAWQLTSPATAREIEGYASATSVNRGGQITVFVNTAESSYTINFYRMGWYGGAGARLVFGPVSRAGTVQTTPAPDPTTGLVECRWTNGYVLTVPNTADPTDWASGVYLAKLTAGTSGKQSYVIFVVRDDARAADFLFQSSVTTFEAYNNWGGKSLYGWNSTNSDPARKVSFSRPYAASPNPAAAYGVGSGEFVTNVQPGPEAYSGISSAGFECNMVRFLEREGYDVTYATDVDTHASPTLLNNRKAFLSVGHDEYWSWEMRANIEAARDRGVGLGFFSSNTCYWQVRFEAGAGGVANRTMVGYKGFAAAEDPLAKDADTTNDMFITGKWRDNTAKKPEEALLGVMYVADPVDADIIIEDASHWACANTGLHNGDHLPGLLGYEVDRMFFDYPPGTTRIARSPFTRTGLTDESHMVSSTAASGATVFATGSIQWSWGLDDYNAPALRTSRLSPAAQHMTRNVLARLAGQPQPPPPPAPTPTPTPPPPVLVFGDDFNDNLLDAAKWALGTIQGAIFSGPAAWDSAIPAREQNGRLEITPRVNVAGDHYNGYVSARGWDMTGAGASAEVVAVASGGATDTQLAVCLDSQNFYMMVHEGGWLYSQVVIAGARTSFSTAYDPLKHRFWRIRHDRASDTVVFETSADRLSWTTLRADVRSLPLTSMKIELSAGTWRAETTTGTAIFDNFRLEAQGATPTPTPTPTPTQTPIPTPTPSPTPTPTNKPPVANPGGPYTGTTGTALRFDGSRSSDPDGSIASYSWNFGDGTTATGATPSKTYSAAGTFTVRLTVTDNKGATASATTTATVNPTPPIAPTNLNATALDTSRIKLTWSDNSSGETGFKIERWNPSTSSFSQIATVGTGVTTFTDSGRAHSTTYYYRVRAYNSGGNSAYSNIDGARTF